MTKRWVIIISSIIVVCWLAPYIAAYQAGGDSLQFGGFFLNWIDGNSYLAKMRLGWEGEWIFTLPYTAAEQTGTFLFIFYIFLGHIARITHLPLIGVFHISRLVCAVFMMWAVWRFIIKLFAEHDGLAMLAYTLVVGGSGLGWLFSPLIGPTADLWVAEAYPFLSGFSNPHFCAGTGLLVLIVMESLGQINTTRGVRLLFLGVLLFLIMPFALVILAVILFTNVVLNGFLEGSFRWEKVLWPVTAGGILLVLQFLAVVNDPFLTQWNAQNITTTPPLTNVVISFSPVLIVAAISLFWMRELLQSHKWRLVICWMFLGFLLIFLPFGLQRRFMHALYIPVALLCIYTLRKLPGKRRRWIAPLVALSTLTNILVLSLCFYGISMRSTSFFLATDEVVAFQWMERNLPARSLILSGPKTGNLIPAYTSHRVIYGHPFETANSEMEKEFVQQYFITPIEAQSNKQALRERGVRYIYFGPDEKVLGDPGFDNLFPIVYQNFSVTIYQVKE